MASTDTVNIRFGTPNGALSNLTARRFVIDDIECASMEGFLQSLKYEDLDKQKYCCTLTGHEARFYGRQAPDWRERQLLYWNGVAYDRHGSEYWDLVWRAYNVLFESENGAKQALLRSGSKRLVHTVGRSNPKETILTEREFCSILTTCRRIHQTVEFLGWD